MKKIIAWWSAGITSAIACKLAIERYKKENLEIIYFHIESAHTDNNRFKADCENWYQKEIKTYCSKKYKDQFEIFEKRKFVNSPMGALCTYELKKSIRQKIEKEIDFSHQVFGFEFSLKEIQRSLRFKEQYPHTNPLFPLIEAEITKLDCVNKLARAKIQLPAMYLKGYSNNNCIGCVKGGMGYWNKIRKDFPETFSRMAALERKFGRTCINGIFLDELEPNRGRYESLKLSDCGIFCDLEFDD